VTAARFSVVLLSAMIIYGSLLTGYPNIAFPWYLNTEEFPYIQEILRFSELDFRQQFFDIPGTPLMTLGTAVWSIWYWICVVAGMADASHGIRYFSFSHMQWLYGLMRVISYLCYATSVVLTYSIGRRLTNAVGGYVAALMLVLSPMYGQTMLYLRIESTSLALVLFSVWSVLRALDSRQYRPGVSRLL
jgi:dolichyl-phosphate-mannose-protein mannosyltransferase